MKWLKAVGGLLVLVAILFTVLSFYGNYREAQEARNAPAETTATPEAAPAEETAEEGEQPAEEQPAEGSDQPAEEGGKVVIVVIDGLNFRPEPSPDGAPIRGLAKNDRLTYLGTENGWYHVRDVEGTEGYVSANSQYTRLEDR